MIGNKRRLGRRITAAVILFLVFSVLYLLLSPYLHDEVGEGEDIPASATVPATESESAAASPAVDKSSEYLILVNKDHGLGKDYHPKDLVKVKSTASDRQEQYQKLRKAAAAAFNRLTKAAKKQGYTIKLTSGFRPYSYQKALYNQYIKEDGKNRAEQYSAKPGYSEHQTGLVADVSSPSVNYNLVQAYGTTEEGKWLAKNAHKYGFIIRYLKGKEDITGYEYEPWHLRYVGKDAAREIHKQGLTLEEYLGEV